MKHLQLCSSDRGSLAVEGAIAFPVVVLLLFATVDLGIVCERYFALSRAAYEGARYGASLNGLTAGTFQRTCMTGTTPSTSAYACATTSDILHSELQDRIMGIMSANGFSDLSRTEIETSYTEEVSTGPNGEIDATSNYVRVRIRMPIPLITTVLGNELPINAAASAPHLYR